MELSLIFSLLHIQKLIDHWLSNFQKRVQGLPHSLIDVDNDNYAHMNREAESGKVNLLLSFGDMNYSLYSRLRIWFIITPIRSERI